MIDLSDLTNHSPLVILRGEYGIVKGENSLLASPNAKNGIILILSSVENQMLVMAHFDDDDKIQANLEKILNEMLQAAGSIKNIKCNLMGKEDEKAFEKKVKKFFEDQENQIEVEVNHESWSGNHSYNILAAGSGEILIDNSSDLMRALINRVLFMKNGEKRVTAAMNPEVITDLALVSD